MPVKKTVNSPAKYVLSTAIGFSGANGDLTLVTPDAPLPVVVSLSDIGAGTGSGAGTGTGTGTSTGTGTPAEPLEGKADASTAAGPFVPTRDAPMHLQLSGTWEGSVTLERSIDGGKTRQGVTAGGMPWARFTDNVNEPVWQESGTDATFWLQITLQSGQVSYWLSQ